MPGTDVSQLLTVRDATLPPMAFRLPHGIHAMEVPLDADERVRAAHRLVRDIYPQGTESLWDTLSMLYSAMADELLADGVAFFGIGLYELPGGEGVAHCSLTVAVHERAEADPDIVAEATRAALRDDPRREVMWLDLPCGPAVCAITFRKMVVDGAYTRSGADEDLVVGQFQVHIPFPAAPCTVVLTLDTAAVDQWEEFSHAMAGIVRSVEFPSAAAFGTRHGDTVTRSDGPADIFGEK